MGTRVQGTSFVSVPSCIHVAQSDIVVDLSDRTVKSVNLSCLGCAVARNKCQEIMSACHGASLDQMKRFVAEDTSLCSRRELPDLSCCNLLVRKALQTSWQNLWSRAGSNVY